MKKTDCLENILIPEEIKDNRKKGVRRQNSLVVFLIWVWDYKNLKQLWIENPCKPLSDHKESEVTEQRWQDCC